MNWNYFESRKNIDLRKELHNLLHGSQAVNRIGQWVILRRFDLTKFSEFYNEITREGVGGPKYKYTDELYLTYKWNSFTSDPFNEQQVPAGTMSVPLVTFFFEYNVNPKEEDDIFEFDWPDHTITPTLSQISKPYSIRYNIKNASSYRLDNGRIEYFECKSVKENVKY